MVRDWTLYVLELKTQISAETKWYVGITSNPEQRLTQHKSRDAVEWVRQNRIVEMHLVDKGRKSQMWECENLLTKALMAEYGIDSTRGG